VTTNQQDEDYQCCRECKGYFACCECDPKREWDHVCDKTRAEDRSLLSECDLFGESEKQTIDKETLEHMSNPTTLAGMLNYMDVEPPTRQAIITAVLEHLGDEESERQTTITQMLEDLIE
jgi:hypothetical protein